MKISRTLSAVIFVSNKLSGYSIVYCTTNLQTFYFFVLNESFGSEDEVTYCDVLYLTQYIK